ncbi:MULTISPECIES: hypothetical protein [Trichocoleus]|uniref:Uncharacterized protein n=1 Tax=Trichocoleus desertorum GB2-A4 TaxID=2933944 RepID=A0ABV0J8I6_9CYAN|nr:hypothetical protein [Trichocoleus sp. FACHB-46]MBD1861108.1 hypothetical protein [Trichocoleus sp. FACHB-46]
MPKPPALPSSALHHTTSHSSSQQHWHSFSHMLKRLHAEGVYLHPQQLAEFLVVHGLPVDLRYVPERLQQKAMSINAHYNGDMAALAEDSEEQPWDDCLGDFD